eukprot:5891027-Amphidinium_carterae.1
MDVQGQRGPQTHVQAALKYTMTCMYRAAKQTPVYWQNLALPFGATGSVYEVNALNLMEPMVTADFASKAVEALLRALGWLYDAEGAKCNLFVQSAVVLGVALEIRATDLVVANTARRTQQ